MNRLEILALYCVSFFIIKCGNHSQSKSNYINYVNAVPKKVNLENISVYRLLDFLPKNRTSSAERGILFFENSDSVYYPESTPVFLMKEKNLVLAILEKDGYYNFYLLHNGTLFQDAYKASDSLVAYSINDNLLFESFVSNLGLKIELIHFNTRHGFNYYVLPYVKDQTKTYLVRLENDTLLINEKN